MLSPRARVPPPPAPPPVPPPPPPISNRLSPLPPRQMIDDNHAIVASSVGPEYYVNIM